MDFRGVKRKELQALCKKNGIPANLSNLDMAQRLTSLFKEKEKPVTRGRSCLKNSNLVETGSKEAKKVSFSPVNETFEFVASETDSVKENPRAARAARRRSMSKPPENGGNVIEPLIKEPNSVSVEEIGSPKKRRLRNREVAVVEVENRGTKKNVVKEDHRKRNSVRRSCEDKTFATEAASFAPGNVRRRSKRNLEKAGSSAGVDFRSEFKRDTEPPPSPGLDPNAVQPLKCLISEGVSKIDEGVEEHMELPPPKGRQRGSKGNDAIAINKSNIASASEERVVDEAVRTNVPLKQRREAHRRKETNVTDDIKKETQKKNRNLACKSSVPENEPVPEEPLRRSSRIAPTHDPLVPAGMCVNASRRREQQTKPKSVMMERGSEIKESETASSNIPILSPMKKVSEKKMKGKKGSRNKSHAKEGQHCPGEFNPMTTELEKGKDVVTETVVAAAPDQHGNSSAKQQHSLEGVNPVITELEEGKDVVTASIAATSSSDQQLQIPLCESLVSTEVENMFVESDHIDQSYDGSLSHQKGDLDHSDEVKSQLKESETARSSNNPVLSLMTKVSEEKLKGKKGSMSSKSHAKEQRSPDEFNPMTTELEKGKDVMTTTVVSAAPDQHSNSSAKQQHSLVEVNPVIAELEEGKVVVTEIIAATSSDQQLQNPLRESLVSTEVENMLVESDHVDQGDDGCLSHQKGDLDHSDEDKRQSLDYQDQPSGALVSHNTTSAKGCSPIPNLDREDGGSYVVALDRWNGKENEGSPIGGCFEVIHAAEGEITSVLKDQNIVEYEEQTVGEPDLENIKVSGEFNVFDGKEDNLRTLKERENNEDESSVTRMTASEIVLHEVTEKNQLCKALDISDEVIRSGYSFIVSQKGTHKKYGSSPIALESGKEMEVEERSSAGQDSLPVIYSANDDTSSFNRAQNSVEREEPQGVAEPIIYKSVGLDCDSEIHDIDPKREISPHVLKSPVCPLGLEQVVLKSDEGLESICFDDGKVHSPMSSTIEHKNDADVLEGNCSLVQSSELMEVDKYNFKEPFSFSVDAAEEENNKALDGKFEVDDSDSVSTADTSEDLAECLEKDGVRETVNWMDTLHRGESVVQHDKDEPIMVTSVALDSAERAVCLDGVDTRELLDENAEILLQNDDLKCKDFANYREELDLRVDKRANFKSDEVADRNKIAATAASTITLVHNDFAGDASQQVSPEEFLGHYLVKEGCTVNDDDAPISILGHVCEIDPGQSKIVIDGKAISESIKGETSSCKTPLSSLRSSSSSMRGLENSMKIKSFADASNYKLSTVSEMYLSSSQVTGEDTLEFNFVSNEIKGEEVAKSNSGESETYFHFGASQDKPTSIVTAAEDENSNQMEKMEKESAKMNHSFSAVSKEPAWEDDTFSIEFQVVSPHELVMAEAVVMDSSKDSAVDEPVSDDKGVNKVDGSVQTDMEYVIPLAGLNTLGDTETVGLNEGVPNQYSSMTNQSSAFINMPRNSDSTAEDAQRLESRTVDCERRKQGARVEEHSHVSARKLNSSVMKGVKRDASYLIQSAPKRSVKMFDMKENAPSIKREHISNITAALEELQPSPSMKREQVSNIGAQPATKRQALEKLQTTANIKSEQTSHTTTKTARNRLAFES